MRLFFPAPHTRHTRTDDFSLPALSLHSVLCCQIGSIPISDHARGVMDLSLKGTGNRVKYWRLNTTILKDHTFVSFFNTELKSFLSMNSQ